MFVSVSEKQRASTSSSSSSSSRDGNGNGSNSNSNGRVDADRIQWLVEIKDNTHDLLANLNYCVTHTTSFPNHK